jgi:hypothetical protein
MAGDEGSTSIAGIATCGATVIAALPFIPAIPTSPLKAALPLGVAACGNQLDDLPGASHRLRPSAAFAMIAAMRSEEASWISG